MAEVLVISHWNLIAISSTIIIYVNLFFITRRLRQKMFCVSEESFWNYNFGSIFVTELHCPLHVSNV